MMKKLLSIFATFIIGGNAFTQTKPFVKTLPYDSASVPREHVVDFKHLKLVAEFIPEQGKIIGNVTHVFTPIRQSVDSIFLDAPSITIKSIQFQSKNLKWKTSPDGITLFFEQSLTWDKTDSLQISYEATPRKGLYFVGWNDKTNRSRKQIWTQGQGTDNRHWIPMYDEMNDKVTSEMIITMPKPYKVLSNGVKLGVSANGENQVWHYKMNKPHAPYLIMLGIGEYEIETRTAKSGLQTDLWYYPNWKDRVAGTYKFSTEMIDFFEKEIGVPYPWETYSQIPVQEFMYGAMENTTATVYGDFFMNDERGQLDRTYIGVNAHELAHQWFGDMVTARSATHHWLQESFATHYNMLYEKEAFGQDFFDQARRNSQNAALSASMKDLYPVASSKAGSSRWYPKGAFVLEMLKYIVGREAYNRTVKQYLLRNAYGNVTSNDLLIAFSETLGQSLDWFWEQWIYRGNEPYYKVEALSTSASTLFTVKQMQQLNEASTLFKMPIVFEVHFTDGTKASNKVWVEQKTQSIEVIHPANKTVAYTLFDPNNQVMKIVEFVKPFEQLKAQAKSAEYMLDRLDAILAMEKIDINQKRDFLIERFAAEKWHTIKSAIIEQLAKDKNAKSIKLLTLAIKDADVKVRNAVQDNFDTIPSYLIKPMEVLLADRSYDVQQTALEQLCKSNPKKIATYLDATKSEMGNNAHNVRITWLQIAIKNGQTKFTDELIDFTSNAFEFNTRRSAFAALRELNIFNETIAEHANNAASSANGRLSNGGIGFLNWAYNSNESWKNIIATNEPKWRVNAAWQDEVWKKIKAPKK